MNTRRLELGGMRWVVVADRAGMSVQNLLRIRKGQIAVTAEARLQIGKGLEIEPDSITDVIDGVATKLRPVVAPPSLGEVRNAQARILAATPEQLVEMMELVEHAYAREFPVDIARAKARTWLSDAMRIREQHHTVGRNDDEAIG
jgi:transcriptional regulator with XRE-family HTH domain